MKKISTIALLCLLSISLFAQFEKINVEEGEKYFCFGEKDKAENEKTENLYVNSTQEIITSISHTDPKFMNDMDIKYRSVFGPKLLNFSKLVQLDKTVFGIFIPRIHYIMLEDKLYAFIQGDVKKTVYLKVCEVDMQTGAWKGEAKTLVSTDEPLATTFEYGAKTVSPFSFSYSMNKKSIVVHYRYVDLEKVNGEKYAKMAYLILDKDMKKLAGGDVMTPLPENQLSRKYITSDSKNRFYLFCELTRDKKDGVKSELYTLQPNETQFATAQINTGFTNITFRQATMAEDKNGDIYLACMANDNGTCHAFRIFKLSKDKKTLTSIFEQDYKVSPSDIENQHIKYNGKVNEVESKAYTIGKYCIPHQLIFNPDASFYLLYSHKSIDAYYSGSGGISGFSNTYPQPDFCIIKISSTGKTVWQKEILNAYRPLLNNENFIKDNDDFYCITQAKNANGNYDLVLNKISNGKIETKVLVKDISGITNIENADDHTLIAQVVYKYAESKPLERKIVKVSLK